MTHAMGGYPYAAYLKTIKCLGADNNHLESIGFKLDGGAMEATGLMPKKDPNDETEKKAYNSGAHHRGLWFIEGNTFEMQGRLLTDVCDLSRYLLNNTEVTLKLYRNRPEFILGGIDATKGYKILLEEIYLQVAYVKPSPGVLMGVGNALEKNHKALYPFPRCAPSISQNSIKIFIWIIFFKTLCHL